MGVAISKLLCWTSCYLYVHHNYNNNSDDEIYFLNISTHGADANIGVMAEGQLPEKMLKYAFNF